MAYNIKDKDELSLINAIHHHGLFHHLLKNINKGVIFTNHANEILYANDKFSEITGYSFPEVEGKTPKFMQSGIQSETFYDVMKHDIKHRNQWQGKLWNQTKNGDVYLQELTIYALKDESGKIDNFIGFIEKLSGHEAISYVDKVDSKLYDPLTHLPNRVFFEKRLYSILQLTNKKDTHIMLTFFQIENFHEVNSKFGLVFGNILLKRIAKRMERKASSRSMISRWDGTIFALVTEEHRYQEDMIHMINQYANILMEPYIINGISIEISVKFGITTYDKANEDMSISALLDNSKRALVQAKHRNHLFCFYDSSMNENGNFVVNEAEIIRGLKNKEFELYYQPLLTVETNELIGFEALIRWNHPVEGVIFPGDFIPFAEKTGLINEIGAFVFEEACRQQVKWSRQGHEKMTISVNLSMHQLKDDFIVHFINETIDKTGADPNYMSIELTESSFSDDIENTIFKLKQLNKLGLTIAIDDFGTGYSSLGYLIDFPINVIKIDRSFIKVLESNEKIEAIVKAINSMARTLNIKVVAEGIETEAQHELVKQLKCNIVQGFLFDRPQSVHTIQQKWLSIK